MANIFGKEYRFVSELPELFAQWDLTKNDGIDPSKIPVRSLQRYWFRCPKCGHSQFTSPFNKTQHRKVGGCRACNGQTVCNYDASNSFGKVYPNLVQYWDYDKNKDTPFDVTSGSGHKRWFKCRTCGTSHIVPVYLFPQIDGCIHCIHHISSSFGEFAIAFYFRKCGFNVIQNDREMLNGLELDVVVPDLKLAVEYDGSVWHSLTAHKNRDVEKFNRCQKLGYRLFRVVELASRDEIDKDRMRLSCDWYTSFRTTNTRCVLDAAINELMREAGFSPDVDTDRDHDKIEANRLKRRIDDSITNDNRLSCLWDYERNGISPDLVHRGCSSARYWFKCPRCGQPWFTTPAHASDRGGCKLCHPRSGHRLMREYTLPDMRLVREWDSAYQAEKAYGFPIGATRRAAQCQSKQNPHVYMGRYWEFV